MPAYNSWLTYWPFFADCEDSFIACENRLPWPGLILKFQQIMLLFWYLMISWQNNWHQIKILNEILSTSSSISAKSHFILLGISKHKKETKKSLCLSFQNTVASSVFVTINFLWLLLQSWTKKSNVHCIKKKKCYW